MVNQPLTTDTDESLVEALNPTAHRVGLRAGQPRLARTVSETKLIDLDVCALSSS